MWPLSAKQVVRAFIIKFFDLTSSKAGAAPGRVSFPKWLNLLFWLLPVAVLWLGLIRQLSVEWSLNPQYSYGWAVPALCVVLVCRDLRQHRSSSATASAPALRFRPAVLGLATLISMAYGVTRLFQEANPDWRLVSWLMTLEALGLTILAWKSVSPLSVPRFPLLFFLIAVPWPTLIEAPIIHSLTAAIAASTAEILGCIGIPAVLRGNIIEVNSGMVGVEEACSGIRSLQASIMVALFFGHWYRLIPRRRLLCLLSGFTLALVFNLARTVLLTIIAAIKGIPRMEHWHELAGVLIPLSCFIGIWLNAKYLQKFPASEAISASELPNRKAASRPFSFLADCTRPPVFPALLLFWIITVGLGTRGWYRLQESSLPEPVVWRVEPPRDRCHFLLLPLSQTARRILRYSDATNFAWADESGLRWQAIFLQWNPREGAVRLPHNHTPVDCLTAAGHELIEPSGLRILSVQGLDLPFRSYVVRTDFSVARVFYCLWEDRAARRTFDSGWLTYRERWAAVLAGQRNSGQRSLELAVWGAATQQDAEAALQPLLNQIVRVDR